MYLYFFPVDENSKYAKPMEETYKLILKTLYNFQLRYPNNKFYKINNNRKINFRLGQPTKFTKQYQYNICCVTLGILVRDFYFRWQNYFKKTSITNTQKSNEVRRTRSSYNDDVQGFSIYKFRNLFPPCYVIW